MSIVWPMYGFVAALFTRMSTRAEPLHRRGDARVGLRPARRRSPRTRRRRRRCVGDRGLERVGLAGRDHHPGAARARAPARSRARCHASAPVISATLPSRRMSIGGPALEVEAGLAARRARTRRRGRPAPAGSGTPRRGSRPRSRRRARTARWSPASTLRTVGPTWIDLGPHEAPVHVRGGRDEDPGAGLALPRLGRRLARARGRRSSGSTAWRPGCGTRRAGVSVRPRRAR